MTSEVRVPSQWVGRSSILRSELSSSIWEVATFTIWTIWTAVRDFPRPCAASRCGCTRQSLFPPPSASRTARLPAASPFAVACHALGCTLLPVRFIHDHTYRWPPPQCWLLAHVYGAVPTQGIYAHVHLFLCWIKLSMLAVWSNAESGYAVVFALRFIFRVVICVCVYEDTVCASKCCPLSVSLHSAGLIFVVPSMISQ